MSPTKKKSVATTTTPKGHSQARAPQPRKSGRLQRALDETAAREIRAALGEAKGGLTAAAKLLGISKVALWKRMKTLGIGRTS